MNRSDSINAAASEYFDVCIIGGGITGAGLLQVATEKGWKAILIEKNDLASGTSSRSSKIIHGGVRYITHFNFKLVKEALRERAHLMKDFAYLIKPLAFVFPSYNNRLAFIFKSLVFTMYDLLAGGFQMEPHKRLNAKETIQLYPLLKKERLKGAIRYLEGVTSDARLVIDVICGCALKGQTVLSYMKAIKAERGERKVTGLFCVDTLSGSDINIKAQVYVNATGVWTDSVLSSFGLSTAPAVSPSKGIHLVFPSARLKADHAYIFSSTNGDGRYLYLIPWRDGLTIAGSTDTKYTGDLDELETEETEVDYILDALNQSFPSITLRKTDVLAVYAGLRPLVPVNKVAESYNQSREYKVWWSDENVINIAGGKLTSFLSMAYHCMEMVSKNYNMPPRDHFRVTEEGSSENWPLYGPFGTMIDQLLSNDPTGYDVVSTDPLIREAEIIFCIRYQFALSVEDILTRRFSLSYSMKIFDSELVSRVSAIMASELKKDKAWIEDQHLRYYRHWQSLHPSFIYQK